MRLYEAFYRVRLTKDVGDQVAGLSERLRLSEAETLRLLVGVALTAPPQLLEAAAQTARARAARGGLRG